MHARPQTGLRVIQLGHPIRPLPDRSHLLQFYAMVSFCNPGVLGAPSEFKRRFENPILASREPTASADAVTRGEQVSEELSSLVNNFILRRTNTLLSKFQPPKARPPPPPNAAFVLKPKAYSCFATLCLLPGTPLLGLPAGVCAWGWVPIRYYVRSLWGGGRLPWAGCRGQVVG